MTVRLVGVVALIFIGFVAFGVWRDHRLDGALNRVRPGMSETQARSFFGKPTWRGRCGYAFPYGFSDDCATELGYRGSFAPLIPAYFVVQLDRQGRVISADPINSP